MLRIGSPSARGIGRCAMYRTTLGEATVSDHCRRPDQPTAVVIQSGWVTVIGVIPSIGQNGMGPHFSGAPMARMSPLNVMMVAVALRLDARRCVMVVLLTISGPVRVDGCANEDCSLTRFL